MPIRTSSLGASKRTSIATLTSSTRRSKGSISRVYNSLPQSQQYTFKINLVRMVNPSLLKAQPPRAQPQLTLPLPPTINFVFFNLTPSDTVEGTILFENPLNANITSVIVNDVPQIISRQSIVPYMTYWQATFIVSGLPPLSNGSNIVVSLIQGNITSQNYNFYVGTPVVRDLNVTSVGNSASIQYIGIDNTSTYLGGLSATITNLQYILKNNSGNTLTTAVLDWDPTPTFPISIGENLTNNTQYSLGVRAENKHGFGPYYYVTFTTS